MSHPAETLSAKRHLPTEALGHGATLARAEALAPGLGGREQGTSLPDSAAVLPRGAGHGARGEVIRLLHRDDRGKPFRMPLPDPLNRQHLPASEP